MCVGALNTETLKDTVTVTFLVASCGEVAELQPAEYPSRASVLFCPVWDTLKT